jgi:hypothetical protein
MITSVDRLNIINLSQLSKFVFVFVNHLITRRLAVSLEYLARWQRHLAALDATTWTGPMGSVGRLWERF